MLCVIASARLREIVDLTNGNIKSSTAASSYMRDVTPVVTWLARQYGQDRRKSGPGTGQSSQMQQRRVVVIDVALIAIRHV